MLLCLFLLLKLRLISLFSHHLKILIILIKVQINVCFRRLLLLIWWFKFYSLTISLLNFFKCLKRFWITFLLFYRFFSFMSFLGLIFLCLLLTTLHFFKFRRTNWSSFVYIILNWFLKFSRTQWNSLFFYH